MLTKPVLVSDRSNDVVAIESFFCRTLIYYVEKYVTHKTPQVYLHQRTGTRILWLDYGKEHHRLTIASWRQPTP